jgi:hypothetical protein
VATSIVGGERSRKGASGLLRNALRTLHRWGAAVWWWLAVEVAFAFTAIAPEAFQRGLGYSDYRLVPAVSQKGELLAAAVSLSAIGIIALWRDYQSIRAKWLADFCLVVGLAFVGYVGIDYGSLDAQVKASAGQLGSLDVGWHSWEVFVGAVGNTTLGAVLVSGAHSTHRGASTPDHGAGRVH